MRLKPGYKLTELGEIPIDWNTQSVASVSSKILDYRGRTPRKLGMEWGGGDIPALSAGNVRMGYIDFDEECYFASEALYKRWMTTGHASKGDICFTTEAPLGNVAKIPDSKKYILSQRTVLLQPNSNITDSDYLFQFLKSDRFQTILSENATGSTAKGIQRKRFEKLPIVCPPLPEQRAIAAALSDVDALVDKLDHIINKKRDLKLAAMQQLLTGKTRLPGFKVTECKHTDVGYFPVDWDVKRLSEIGESLIGLTYSPDNVKSDGLLVLRSSNVQNGKLCFDDNVYVDVKVPERIIVKKGDILVCVRNGSRHLIGKCAQIDDYDKGMTFGAFMAVFRTPLYPFVFHQFQADIIKRQIHEHLGATINQITNKSLNSFQVPLPSDIREQVAISKVLSDMDAELAALEARREKTLAVKQAMMQELLTGRIRIV